MEGMRRMKLKRYLFKFIFITVIFLVASNPSQARKFTLINKCSFPVWFGFLGGNNTPAPADNNYQLKPGDSSLVNIPLSFWSGVIAGRTNCSSSGCQTADCGGGTGRCAHGFNPPATQVEFTMNANGYDNYDVEVINGVNVPISVAPDINTKASDPYYCGAPGATSPSPGLGACSWNLNPPLVEFNWVTNGGNACSKASDCSGGLTCGLSFNPGQAKLLQKTCGKLLGYWTADQICGIQRDYGAPFNCNKQLTIPQKNRTWWDLYACIPPINSCYSGGVDNTCCGCVNWDQINIPVPSSPTTQRCTNVNPNWKSGVQPYLEWLKRACPTSYTYPYDDPSSSFRCPVTANYTITFCPNNNLPEKKCLPPANIQTSYAANKKSITLSWQQPAGSDTVLSYQVNDWKNRRMWVGSTLSYIDNTLPGTNGTFTYFLYSNCSSGQSDGVQKNVVIK